MTCEAAREILDHAFDGVDQGGLLNEADIHADACESCAAYRRELRAYAALMEDLPEVEIPEGLEDRLLVAVERTRPKRRSPMLPVTFAAFLAFGAIIGTQLVSHHAEDRAREARDAQEHKETISRTIARDRAMYAAEPINGTPAIALTGYAGR